MNDLDASVFSALFKKAYEKCFGHPMSGPLTETESRLFSEKILDQTGLVIGAKSIKNYSSFVLSPANGKEENPSVATLDTFARFVLDAPYTDEVQRKNKQSHYPYWFQYRQQFQQPTKKQSGRKKQAAIVALISSILAATTLLIFSPAGKKKEKDFTDDFHQLQQDSLSRNGWFLKAKDDEYWNRRNESPGHLTLFTLKGDNWPDSVNQPNIKNLLLRKNNADCFVAEIHLSEFVPLQNWQQAGMLLLEDTSFAGKSLRLSLVYNDFSGGFPKSREIILQAIISGGKATDKPEEIVHQLLFKIDSANEKLVRQNLLHSALRVEKNGKSFRLLFANGSMPNSAFREILNRDIDMKPAFIGLFALKGFVDSSTVIPAKIDLFRYTPLMCKR
ncbi:MAG TPA: hypothetical protein VFI06_16670 [Chitinophagaceae bacterium]|nr:hypothetical protein [Chitinophagaceae bacterium]